MASTSGSRQTSGAYLRHLRILQFLLLVVQGGFAMIALFMVYYRLFITEEIKPLLLDVFVVVLPICCVTCILIAHIAMHATAKSADKRVNLSDKLAVFDDSIVLFWTFLCLPNGVVIIAYIVTGYMPFLLYFLGILGYQLLSTPGPRKIIRILGLNEAHADKILNDENIY